MFARKAALLAALGHTSEAESLVSHFVGEIQRKNGDLATRTGDLRNQHGGRMQSTLRTEERYLEIS